MKTACLSQNVLRWQTVSPKARRAMKRWRTSAMPSRATCVAWRAQQEHPGVGGTRGRCPCSTFHGTNASRWRCGGDLTANGMPLNCEPRLRPLPSHSRCAGVARRLRRLVRPPTATAPHGLPEDPWPHGLADALFVLWGYSHVSETFHQRPILLCFWCRRVRDSSVCAARLRPPSVAFPHPASHLPDGIALTSTASLLTVRSTCPCVTSVGTKKRSR